LILITILMFMTLKMFLHLDWCVRQLTLFQKEDKIIQARERITKINNELIKKESQ